MEGGIFYSVCCQYKILVICKTLPAKSLSPAAGSELKHRAYPSSRLQRHHLTPLWVRRIQVLPHARTNSSHFWRSPSSPPLGSWIPLRFILKHQQRGIAFYIVLLCLFNLPYWFDLLDFIL